MLDRERRIAQRTAQHQALARKLRRARRAHQEGHVHAGLGQATTEVTAGPAGTEDQDAHQLRIPTPRFSSHSASAVRATTKPIISA